MGCPGLGAKHGFLLAAPNVTTEYHHNIGLSWVLADRTDVLIIELMY